MYGLHFRNYSTADAASVVKKRVNVDPGNSTAERDGRGLLSSATCPSVQTPFGLTRSVVSTTIITNADVIGELHDDRAPDDDSYIPKFVEIDCFFFQIHTNER